VITNANKTCYWREFEKNRVSHSAAHYLMAIDALRGKLGYARVTDVAVRLEVTRAAASAALSQLKKRELVAEDPNRFLLLTEEGARVVEQVEQNFRTLSRFFEEVLGVSPEVAQADACKMEHLISLETGRRLLWLMALMLDNAEHAAAISQAMAAFENPVAQERDPTERDPTERDPTERDPAERDPTERDPTERDPTERDPTERDPTECDPAEVRHE